MFWFTEPILRNMAFGWFFCGQSEKNGLSACRTYYFLSLWKWCQAVNWNFLGIVKTDVASSQQAATPHFMVCAWKWLDFVRRALLLLTQFPRASLLTPLRTAEKMRYGSMYTYPNKSNTQQTLLTSAIYPGPRVLYFFSQKTIKPHVW